MAKADHKLRYFFCISTNLAPGIGVDPGPRGIRAHVAYEADGSTVKTEEAAYKVDFGGDLPEGANGILKNPACGTPLPYHKTKQRPTDPGWYGLFGKVASGGDFLLIRTDGVIDMDGRVTIRANDGSLIDASYRGSIDLRAHAASTYPSGKAVHEAFKRGTYEFATNVIPVTLSVTFETASSPESTDDADMSWVQWRYRATGDNYWRYESLVRHNFLALGTLTLIKQKPDVQQPFPGGKIALHVYQQRYNHKSFNWQVP